MTPKVWGWLLWGSLAVMVRLAIVANVASGGYYQYRDTFKYDNNGDGTAEEIHGATVTAYGSTTTDTTLSGYNFAIGHFNASSDPGYGTLGDTMMVAAPAIVRLDEVDISGIKER